MGLRRLVKESLRMRPSRIVVGEVRQEESLDLLLALSSGLPGMCTIHAGSAREALTKAVHAAAARRRERDLLLRAADRGVVRRPRRAPRAGPGGSPPRAGDRRRARSGRG
nr:ATPase, T2SS/T4P/T4SS family [Angustibacter aerolatus]